MSSVIDCPLVIIKGSLIGHGLSMAVKCKSMHMSPKQVRRIGNVCLTKEGGFWPPKYTGVAEYTGGFKSWSCKTIKTHAAIITKGAISVAKKPQMVPGCKTAPRYESMFNTRWYKGTCSGVDAVIKVLLSWKLHLLFFVLKQTEMLSSLSFSKTTCLKILKVLKVTLNNQRTCLS